MCLKSLSCLYKKSNRVATHQANLKFLKNSDSITFFGKAKAILNIFLKSQISFSLILFICLKTVLPNKVANICINLASLIF